MEKKTPWPESASDSHLSAMLVLTFADKGRHVVSVTDPYGRILGFLDRYNAISAINIMALKVS
jgi:CBS-domain-containing membrane protein